MNKTQQPAGTVYRLPNNPPTWRFSSRTEFDTDTKKFIALDAHPVANEDRLEQFYQAWLSMRDLANELGINVLLRPAMLAEQVNQLLTEAYESGIQDGSSNPNKYRPANDKYVWPGEDKEEDEG